MLEELTLIGMGKEEVLAEKLEALGEEVEIEYRLADITNMRGDATPDQVATPAEFWEEFDD